MSSMALGWMAMLPALAIAVLAAVVSWHGFLPAITFKPLNLTTLSSSLAPLLVVAVLIERTLEVFFGIWREPRNQELERKAELAARAISHAASGGAQMTPLAAAEATAAAGLAPVAGAAIRPAAAPVADSGRVVESASAQLAAAQQEGAERKAETTRLAFLAGGALGVIVALSGVRLLQSMIVMPPSLAWRFQLVDVVLTGGLLGGGAEGFHRVVNVLTAFLKATENKAAGAAPGKLAGTV